MSVKAFALSQGYHGEKQLMYIRSGKDHHKTFDDISRFIDGNTDELLFLYCSSMKKSGSLTVSVSGFLDWTRGLEGNATIRFLVQQCCQYGLGIMLFRHGIRPNIDELSVLGWRMCTPLIHCRNHPRYTCFIFFRLPGLSSILAPCIIFF